MIVTLGSAVRSYSDVSVSPSSTYQYALKAYDAAGNLSAPSAAASVTTPASGTTTACPAPAEGAFTGCYYAGTTLGGIPVLIRRDAQINFNWGTGTPSSALPRNDFSVRWSGYFDFDAAEYRFLTTASDGIRLYIDGQLIIDRWRDQPAYMYAVRRSLTAGRHLVTVEYYERTGLPSAQVSWQKAIP